MKSLVTGANGVTGSHVVRALRAAGHEVRGMVRPGRGNPQLEADGVELCEGELTSAQDVERAVRGCDQVYHIAAVFRTAGHPDTYYTDVNVGGTVRLLEAARKFGCERLVHCSTGGVHGHIEVGPANEAYRFAPDDVYQRSKLEGEQAAVAASQRGQPVAIFRPGPIYGEGDLRFLKLFRSIQKRQFAMIGDGRVKLQMVHLDDLTQGILCCGSRAEALGQIFLLAGPEAPTLNELTDRIAEELQVGRPFIRVPVWPVYAAGWLCEMLCVPFGVEPPLHRRRVGFFTHNREFDISKAKRMIGYDPRISVPEGLRRTIAWYRAQGLLAPAPATTA